MLPTFVIGLLEGIEAALIVGIIAAFLRKETGGGEAMRHVWLGVAAAIGICVAVGVGLNILDKDLPRREQEGLQSIIAMLAVGAVTFMIAWMKRHARSIASDLRVSATTALAAGTTAALVAMAFFAVIREGLETFVFLLAAFQSASDPTAAGIGALLGLLAAVAIGVAIYRGGVKLNLTRFFRLTGVVLVFVAAGLLASALHAAHEAGWLNLGQAQAVDLSWLVVPGTWTSSLLTGMLGLRPSPTVIEAAGYLVYGSQCCWCCCGRSAGAPIFESVQSRPEPRRGRGRPADWRVPVPRHHDDHTRHRDARHDVQPERAAATTRIALPLAAASAFKEQ